MNKNFNLKILNNLIKLHFKHRFKIKIVNKNILIFAKNNFK